jgi:hypothetical protein
MKYTYSCRAECSADVEKLRSALESKRSDYGDFEMRVVPDSRLPDVVVEFTTTARLDQLDALIREIADGHVMLQTLRLCALADDPLERDYDKV